MNNVINLADYRISQRPASNLAGGHYFGVLSLFCFTLGFWFAWQAWWR
jgi:hypothetical protein